jgi:hypothetical protein
VLSFTYDGVNHRVHRFWQEARLVGRALLLINKLRFLDFLVSIAVDSLGNCLSLYEGTIAHCQNAAQNAALILYPWADAPCDTQRS